MRKACIAVVVGVTVICSPASAVPPELPPCDLQIRIWDGTPEGTVHTAENPYVAHLGEIIRIAMFVDNVQHLTGFDAFVTDSSIGVPGQPHGLPLEWMVVGGVPTWPQIGQAFIAAANAPGKSGADPDDQGGTRKIDGFTAMMNEAIDWQGNPTGDDEFVGNSATSDEGLFSGDIAVFIIRAAAHGTATITVDTDGFVGFTQGAMTVLAHDDDQYNSPPDHPTEPGYGGLAYNVGDALVIEIVAPEPATIILLAAGLAWLAARRGRR